MVEVLSDGIQKLVSSVDLEKIITNDLTFAIL